MLSSAPYYRKQCNSSYIDHCVVYVYHTGSCSCTQSLLVSDTHSIYEDCWTFQAFMHPKLITFTQDNTETSISLINT
jgi:hypothetical protein